MSFSMTDITSALQSLTVVKHVLEAHQTLKNFNEAQTVLADVHMKLMAFKENAVKSEEREAAHVQRIRELEEKIKELEDWDREKQRHRRIEFAPGIPSYVLKSGMENDAPSHPLCPTCFEQRQKSYLSYGPPGTDGLMMCGKCGSKFFPSNQKKKTATIGLLS